MQSISSSPAKAGGRKAVSTHTREKYAIIGAGPSGLGTARCFKTHGIPFDGFEASDDVGGLWNIQNPCSSVYETAHLISSKKMTEFTHFPMADAIPDFPSHSQMYQYFRDYAEAFGLYDDYTFNTRVKYVEPMEEGWKVELDTGLSYLYKGIVIANGTLSHPNIPEINGTYEGEILHAKDYKSPEIFDDKRVLIVGAGNSGCDIAVDAVHRASKTSISVRRGYHFVPKYVFGKPADTMGGLIRMPAKIKQRIDKFLLKWFVPDPVKLGFPEPDHKLYESHPVVNNLILHHLGHGDMDVKPDISFVNNLEVHFEDGSSEAYDMILLATGYKLHYPFIDNKYLNWQDMAPRLYLNIFHPEYNNLFVIGMVEATGLGWQGRYDQAELVAQFIMRKQEESAKAIRFIQKKKAKIPDTSGGLNYLKQERMAYYVNKDKYRKLLRKTMRKLA